MPGGDEDAAEDEEGDPRERLQHEVADDAVLELHLREPLGVDAGELLLGLELILDDVVHLRESVGLGHAGDSGFRGIGGQAGWLVMSRSRPMRWRLPFRSRRV